MLGFSSYSETPYSQAVTSLAANALSGGTEVTSSLGSLTLTGTASVSEPAVSGVVSLGTLKPNVNKEITGVTADALVNALLGPAIEEDIVSVSVTASVGMLTTQAKANNTPLGVTASFNEGVLGLDADANKTVTGVAGTNSLNIEFNADANPDVLEGVRGTTDITNASTTAVQKVYSNTDYQQTHVVTVHTTVKNKIVYVRN